MQSHALSIFPKSQMKTHTWLSDFLFLGLLDNNDFMYVYMYIQNIHICIYLILYFFFLGHAPQHVGWNPCPLEWKRRVLSTGSRGKSPYILKA